MFQIISKQWHSNINSYCVQVCVAGGGLRGPMGGYQYIKIIHAPLSKPGGFNNTTLFARSQGQICMTISHAARLSHHQQWCAIYAGTGVGFGAVGLPDGWIEKLQRRSRELQHAQDCVCNHRNPAKSFLVGQSARCVSQASH